jgi:hypothetical protein
MLSVLGEAVHSGDRSILGNTHFDLLNVEVVNFILVCVLLYRVGQQGKIVCGVVNTGSLSNVLIFV